MFPFSEEGHTAVTRPLYETGHKKKGKMKGEDIL